MRHAIGERLLYGMFGVVRRCEVAFKRTTGSDEACYDESDDLHVLSLSQGPAAETSFPSKLNSAY